MTPSSLMRRFSELLACAAAALALGLSAPDQSPPTTPARMPEPVPQSTQDVEDQLFQHFLDGDYAGAAKLIDSLLLASPRDHVLLYNGACAYARLGDPDKAGSYLLRAVEAGFRDFAQMKADPDLDSLRSHDVYQAILEAERRAAARAPATRSSAKAELAVSTLEQWKKHFGEAEYRYEVDDERRLAYATALDEVTHHEMRLMLERQGDHLDQTLFHLDKRTKRDIILVAVPTPADARDLLSQERVGGVYEHARKRLIARNIGSSLRHEFFHLMHYRHMEQVRQNHRLWVMEGMASLYEDYHYRADGGVAFDANERHNHVRGLASAGKLESWRKLFELSDSAFMLRALDLYPQVRSMFEFVAARGLLSAWYLAYVEHFRDDSSGAAAFEAAFGSDLSEIEKQWRRWLMDRPALDLAVRAGDASLGVRISPRSSNDGVVISHVFSDSAASAAKLKENDVIVALDGKAVRTETDLQLEMARREVGQVVQVRIRRGGEYLTKTLTLKALQPF